MFLVAALLVAFQQQNPEFIRGRIVGDSARPVHAADVYVTRAPDRLTQVAHTDSLGRFSIRFDHGTGDYLVNVRAIGYKPLRKRFTRTGADSVIVADITLQTEAVALAPVVATASRLRPSREGGMRTQEGSDEKIAGSGVPAGLSPDQAGDINAIAANIPGITLTPNGASALGLGADQNSVTMNGLNFGGGTVPRDARTNTRVSTSTYDPARGGFSGAQIAVDLSPGNMFSNRRGHITLDAPQLQFGDPYARALGEEYRGLTTSLAADGEMYRDKWYYNVSFQSKNRAADYGSLLSADNSLFTLSGVTPDSARRLVSALQSVGVPATSGVPGSRSTNQYTFLGRIDRTPYGNKAFALTTYLDVNKSDALGISPTVTPSLGGSNTTVNAMVQGIYSFYFAGARNYLADTRSSLSYRKNSGDPYLQVPAGRVLFPSASLGFGGNGALDTESSSWLWQNVADLQLYTKKNRHKVRVHAESQLDVFNQRDPADLFGTYTYQSITDFINNNPASFTRTLQTRSVDGGMWSGVLAVGDNLRASDKLNLLFGARIEGNRFTDRPDFNPAVQNTYGVRTDNAPDRVHVSPRLGFSWRKVRNDRFGMQVSNLMTRFIQPSGILRGGIGEFRGQMSSRLLSDAMRATGLPGGLLQLQCIGSAVPLPSWSSYADNPGLIPEQCANGAPAVFADASRSVQLFASDFDAPRSWRGNLGWSMTVKKVGLTVDGTYSLNVDQPGSYDLNFSPAAHGTLSGEGNRPLYISTNSIVASTGAVSQGESRINTGFGRVIERRSDLRSRSAQVTVSAVPEFSNWKWYGSLSYTLANTRAQFRGFDGGGFGDPTTVEWAPSNFDARHQVVLQLGHVFKPFDVTLQHRMTSGTPFTPLVDGDVNGDGVAGDRAFIFGPLASTAPDYAQDCIAAQVGRAAERNSCRGPWTHSLNVRLSPSKKYINTGKRISMTLAGSKMWNAAPDPILYRVRGFDAANQRFNYDINSRFGDTRSTRSINRNPFRLTLDVSLNLGRNIDIQQLERYLKPGRTQPGARMSADSMEKRYRRNVTDVYEDIIEESDSLLLSKEQIAQLKEAQKPYRAKVDSLWHNLATYLAALPERFNSAEALKRQEDTIDEAWEISRLEGDKIRTILSPLQMQLLGGNVKYVITSKEKLHIRMYMN